MAAVDARFARHLADRYVIEREIGRGGMATVYLAADLKHGRKVAIKVIHPDIAMGVGHDRFLNEIEYAARLSHPHILPLFDSGAVDGQLFYVMPHIGGSLRAQIDHDKRLSLEVALRLAREIASALGHAHRHGLVHRDVKPENILISDGMALVADFGIARAMSGWGERGSTTAGVALGTPAYMAPEQAIGSAEVDGRADLYALACVLYEMLTGQPPFTGRPESIGYQHLSAEPRPVSELCPAVPGEVSEAIARTLAKSPADRYDTAAAFAEALSISVAGRPQIAPRKRGAEDAIPNNLPRERTRFIGRESEVAECARLLDGTRLLALTGVGGCGKTRLALKLAEDLLGRFPDGVWLAELAPLQDAERVTSTLAAALGVRESPGTPLIETLIQHLKTQRTLIVLDNCEHVITASARLADALLRSTDELRLIVTSREGLAVPGERPFIVRPLSVPPPDSESDLTAVEASEAVRLFVDRAEAVDPGFTLTGQNGPSVARICGRLDGIPLAIELAAARMKFLSVEEILGRLVDRFRFLTGGIKTALPRHQTLRATIQWSYDQLSEGEQRLFRLLAVFAGGWTMEAVTHMTSEAADEFELLDVLGKLVDKSLVAADRIDDGSTRYGMLETVRQYAQERLNESGEALEARGRHLGYFVGITGEIESKLTGPNQGIWFARLGREQENLLTAHAWCDHAEGGGHQGLRLLGPTWRYWRDSGQFELGVRVLREATLRRDAQERTPARSLALYAAGFLSCFRGSYVEAQEFLEESVSISRQLDDGMGVVRALNWLGAAASAVGDRQSAQARLEEALALARGLGDKRMLGNSANALAEFYRTEGDLERAQPLYEQTLALGREREDSGHIVIGLLNLAIIGVQRGEYGAVRARIREALEIVMKTRSKGRGQGALDVTSALAAACGDFARAARIWGASEAVRERIGLQREKPDREFILPWIERTHEALGDSAFTDGVTAGRALAYEAALSDACAYLEEV